MRSHHLQGGPLFGLPVVLDTDSEDLKVGDHVLLKYQGQEVATCDIDSKWMPNKVLEAKKCYGTTSIEHPAVHMITTERGKFYMGEQYRPQRASSSKVCANLTHRMVYKLAPSFHHPRWFSDEKPITAHLCRWQSQALGVSPKGLQLCHPTASQGVVA